MRVIVERVYSAKCIVNEEITGEIENGYLLLVCFKEEDNIEIIKKMIDKIIHLRIMDDEFGVMNKNILDTKGSVLSISQFTLYADTSKGHRPSYNKALNGKEASKLYQIFNEELSKYLPVERGRFGEDMTIDVKMNGPVTICLER